MARRLGLWWRFVAVVLVGLAPGLASGRELSVADTHVEDYPTVQALKLMGKLLADRSQGRLTLKVYHSRQLGEEKETIRQAQMGAVDLVRVNLAPFNELVPETVVPSLPFLFRSVQHMHKVMDGPLGAEILKAFERHGLVGLAYYDSGARSFYTAKKMIQQPADLAGLRIRVQQSPLFMAMVEALGAIPVPLAYGQVQVGLSTGVVDGAENNIPSYQEAGHFRTAGYYGLTEHTMAPEVLAMSKKVWDGLSPEDQIMIRKAAQDSVPMMRRWWQEREESSRTMVVRGGAMVEEVDKKPFALLMRPLYDRFAADPDLKDLVRRVQAVE
ncbi:TRAP transporter substrate-binding protein [Paramagnetospirillum kuznetsovii]|uniref:TRAP transporter substrate-binding protein n=1 Tax=Paramagnetospirillum kuznetsovii TaxID=2053833 RepID=UPI0019612587|nr:TRAP transporter substrate-binding protein [Paramagnetospirillum kuznetsovii]